MRNDEHTLEKRTIEKVFKSEKGGYKEQANVSCRLGGDDVFYNITDFLRKDEAPWIPGPLRIRLASGEVIRAGAKLEVEWVGNSGIPELKGVINQYDEEKREFAFTWFADTNDRTYEFLVSDHGGTSSVVYITIRINSHSLSDKIGQFFFTRVERVRLVDEVIRRLPDHTSLRKRDKEFDATPIADAPGRESSDDITSLPPPIAEPISGSTAVIQKWTGEKGDYWERFQDCFAPGSASPLRCMRNHVREAVWKKKSIFDGYDDYSGVWTEIRSIFHPNVSDAERKSGLGQDDLHWLWVNMLDPMFNPVKVASY